MLIGFRYYHQSLDKTHWGANISYAFGQSIGQVLLPAGGCHLSGESSVGYHSIAQRKSLKSEYKTPFLCGSCYSNEFQILV